MAEDFEKELAIIKENKYLYGHLVKNKYRDGNDGIYIGRGSKWGNQWTHLAHTTAPYVVSSREEAVVMHRRNLIKMIRNNEIKLSDLAELADKTLICFCSPDLCHGHTLSAAAHWAKLELQKQGR